MITFKNSNEDVRQLIDYIVHHHKTELSASHKEMYVKAPLWVLVELCFVYDYRLIADGNKDSLDGVPTVELHDCDLDLTTDVSPAVVIPVDPQEEKPAVETESSVVDNSPDPKDPTGQSPAVDDTKSSSGEDQVLSEESGPQASIEEEKVVIPASSEVKKVGGYDFL